MRRSTTPRSAIALCCVETYAAQRDCPSSAPHPLAPSHPLTPPAHSPERDFPGSGPGPAWLSGTDSGGECGVPSAKLFPQPAPGGVVGDTKNLWWASAIGPVFTVHFSSELDSTPGGAMWTFVRDALAGVDRAVTP